MKHELKCINPFFDDIWHHHKNIEIRYNDRNYQIGDWLLLKQCHIHGINKYTITYSGNEILCKIWKIEKFEGLKDNWVMLYLCNQFNYSL